MIIQLNALISEGEGRCGTWEDFMILFHSLFVLFYYYYYYYYYCHLVVIYK